MLNAEKGRTDARSPDLISGYDSVLWVLNPSRPRYTVIAGDDLLLAVEQEIKVLWGRDSTRHHPYPTPSGQGVKRRLRLNVMCYAAFSIAERIIYVWGISSKPGS